MHIKLLQCIAKLEVELLLNATEQKECFWNREAMQHEKQNMVPKIHSNDHKTF